MNKLLRYFLWVVLGLVALFLLLVAAIHLPPVQKIIATRVSQYLSETVGSDVSIKGIHLSIWDGIAVRGISVNDPEGNNLLSSGKIGVMPNLISLISGNIVIHYIGLENTTGFLKDTDQGLNIQFIIDAFSSDSSEQDTVEQGSLSLIVQKIHFQNITFEYNSIPGGTDLNLNLELLDAGPFEISTAPDEITLNRFYLEGVDLAILSTKETDQPDSVSLPPLDFGTGFDIMINEIQLRDHNISYHFGTIRDTKKFNPDHLDLTDTQLKITDILLSEDSFKFDLEELSASLSDFNLSGLSGEVEVGLTESKVSNLRFATDSSQVNIDLSAKYQSWTTLLDQFDQALLNIELQADLHHQDFSYFINDSISAYSELWPETSLTLSGDLSAPLTEIREFTLIAGESQFSTSGAIHNLIHTDSLSWQRLDARISLAEEFSAVLNPLVDGIEFPRQMEIKLSSSGSRQDFTFDTQLTSDAGDLEARGKAGAKLQSIHLVDLVIDGKTLAVGDLLNQTMFGTMDFSLGVNGQVGEYTDLSLTGLISRVGINKSTVNNISINVGYKKDMANIQVNVDDPDYKANIKSDLDLSDEQISINSTLILDQFSLGRLMGPDSTLSVSANITSSFHNDPHLLKATVRSSDLSFISEKLDYHVDTLSLAGTLANEASELRLYSDNLRGLMQANFDARQTPDLLENLYKEASSLSEQNASLGNNRKLDFELTVTSDEPLKLLSSSIYQADEILISGKYEEQDQSFELEAGTGMFQGFGFSFDSLSVNSRLQPNKLDGTLQIGHIFYDSLKLGDFRFQLTGKDSVSVSALSLVKDSVTLLGISSRVQLKPPELSVYLDTLVSFDEPFKVAQDNPIIYKGGNVTFNRYHIEGDWMDLLIDGDLNEFELVVDNTDLQQLNYLLPGDSTLISRGNLNGLFAFVKADKKINLQARIDSLSLKDSPAMNIKARAVSEGSRVPLNFSLTSATNKLELQGDYFSNNSNVSASVEVDINELQMFQIFFKDILEELSGAVTGNVKINGSLAAPQYNGQLRFKDVRLESIKPRSTFHLRNEVLSLDNSGISLNNFTIYDQQENPLRIDGKLTTRDYQNFEYDLSVSSDDYWLINNPRQDGYQLQGNLVIASDIKLKGKPNQLDISADLTVKDTTALTYVMPQQKLELVSGEGIVEFVDPRHPDTVRVSEIKSMYDSVVASLPELNLVSTLNLEEKALLRVVVDANSGDYIEVMGKANLKFEMDRTKNMDLSGSYNITEGFYQLSFYDLVKKKFVIEPGSTITWTGNPNNGDLDILAVYTVKTSSLGLIGDEIGENEKSLYRKALPYEVGIIIKGNLESPEISFSLDLPKNEKANYPTLANKLSRLDQPEYEAALNSQVFGLLVLGAFIPESGAGDVNEHLIATTALSNSVNAILASQLNKFAGQFVKGVDIDVGLQSYSDFSTGRGTTRTAMDFRISKHLMDDRLSIEVGGGMDINAEGSGAYSGSDNFRGDIVVVYDLTESGNKQLKVFNNETYDIVYHEIRNTGVSLIFIREFDKEQAD